MTDLEIELCKKNPELKKELRAARRRLGYSSIAQRGISFTAIRFLLWLGPARTWLYVIKKKMGRN